MRNAQENVRTSNAQQARVIQELNDYKANIDNRDRENEALRIKMSKLMAENNSLGD